MALLRRRPRPSRTTCSVLVLSWLAESCRGFSPDGVIWSSSSFAEAPALQWRAPLSFSSFVRSRSDGLLPLLRFEARAPLRAAPIPSSKLAGDVTPLSPPPPQLLDLHPPAIRAVADALLIRAQNKPDMPLRFVDDGSSEEWETTLACGKIAQASTEVWASQVGMNPAESEEAQIVAGRIVAVLTRLEELEGELLDRALSGVAREGGTDGWIGLGVPEAELKERMSAVAEGDVAAAIDAACISDEKLRHNRARSILAIFLNEVEGPGLRRNGVVIPCMDVNFLSEDEWTLLFGPRGKGSGAADGGDVSAVKIESATVFDTSNVEGRSSEEPERPSLHPIVLDAVEEAFRLRAHNSTTSPLRLVDASTEWFEVHYSIVKFADRFLEKYTSQRKMENRTNEEKNDNLAWTDEELQTIGGRIVGVLTRLGDLEWEWNHRVMLSSLAEPGSQVAIRADEWRTKLGLHPHGVEQRCIRTLDEALLADTEFARVRAERMLALFLLCVEGPGLEASGNSVPGGSMPGFVEDGVQLELMMPRPKKD